MKTTLFILSFLLIGCTSTSNIIQTTDEANLKGLVENHEANDISRGDVTIEASWHFDKNKRVGYEWYNLRICNSTSRDITILPEFSVDTVMNGKRAMLFHSQTDSLVKIPQGKSCIYEMAFKRNNKYRYKPLDREYILCLNYINDNDTTTNRIETTIKRPTFWREGTYYMYKAYTLQNGKVVSMSDGIDRLIIPTGDEYEDNVPQTPASFPGGEKAFELFFKKNVNRPSDSSGNPIRSTVLLDFTVDARGNISDIEARMDFQSKGRPPHPLLIEEAIRITRMMPRWVPATEWDIPVDSRSSLLFRF